MTRRVPTEPTTLEQINALANDRHRLYRVAGREGNRADKAAARLRIPPLTKQLETLWAVHRAELAAVHKRRDFAAIAQDHYEEDTFYDYTARIVEATGWQVEEGGVMVSTVLIDLAELAQAAAREIRQERIDHPLPLSEVMAKRGETLVWTNPHSGVGVVRKVEKVG